MRDELRKSLLGDLADLGNESAEHGAFDDGDQAFEAQQNETIAQLAQIESDELRKIDVALSKIRAGTYGTCDGCQIKIPVARLNALPFSSLCIKCQSKSSDQRTAASAPPKGLAKEL